MSSSIRYLVTFSLFAWSTLLFAQNLKPSSDMESAMYTIDDICNRLTTGEEAILKPFSGPTSGPSLIVEGCDLNEVMEAAPKPDNEQSAKPNEVATGKKYWGLNSEYWGPQVGTGDPNLQPINIRSGVEIFGVVGTYGSGGTAVGNAVATDVLLNKTFSSAQGLGLVGTMSYQGKQDYIPTTTDQVIAEGYHDGTGVVKGDNNLKASNIRKGVRLFGVDGQYECGGTAIAADVLSGKTFSNDREANLVGSMPNQSQRVYTIGQTIDKGYHDGITVEEDANLQPENIKEGVTILGVTGTFSGTFGGIEDLTCSGTLSSKGRWCDNGDGTVLDMTTGLVWLQDASWGSEQTWNEAFTRVAELKSGETNLADGSEMGDWRLPTRLELIEMTSRNERVSSSSMQMFSGVQSGVYWSASTYANNTSSAWSVYLYSGYVHINDKTYTYYVWPVRGGQ